MNSRIALFLLILVTALFTAGDAVAAPEKADDKDRHPLEHYLKEAARSNEGLRSAFEQWKAASEKVHQAQSLPDPRFTYTYFVEEVETRVGPQKQRIGIMQMFPWFGKRSLRGTAAEEMAHAAYQDYLSSKWQLFSRVQHAYADYWMLERSIEVTKAHITLVTNLEKVARTRYKTASAPHSAVVQLQVQLGKLDNRLQSLQEMRQPAAASLNAALNKDGDAKLLWTISMPELTLAMSDKEILALLSKKSPELAKLRHRKAVAETNVELARKERYPDISVGLDYVQTDDGMNMNDPDNGKDPLMAMIALNIPIHFDKYKATQKAAEHEQSSVEAMIRNAGANLSAKLKMAIYNYKDADRRIGLYRDTLIPKAEQAMNVARQDFETGKSGFLELIDAERMLLEFQLEAYRAEAARLKGVALIESIIGERVSEIGRKQ